jgi:hypothetical protein
VKVVNTKEEVDIDYEIDFEEIQQEVSVEEILNPSIFQNQEAQQ